MEDCDNHALQVTAERYGALVAALGETAADNTAGFLAQRQQLDALTDAAREQEDRLQNDLTEHSVNLRQGKQEHDALSAEIASLKARRSNIPAKQIALREALCQALNLAEEDMPFAGELLQVRDKEGEEESDWEGAAERLLHGFGLSLLVPDAHYAKVAEWVDKTHLKGRLVYFRVRQHRRGELPALHPDSLARKLAIKPDSPFYDWLEHELAQRFDIACCTTHEQFRRETRAVTLAGQSKTPGERHEKDDRHRKRYGFLDKPPRIRFRFLDPAQAHWAGTPVQDVTLDAHSFARLRLDITRVFITENEINFLAFPCVHKGLVIFGAGYGFDYLSQVRWLAQCRVYYWGDIDTHGFAILDQIRNQLGAVESLLMDRDTLLAFETLWGDEEKQITRDLPRLTTEEQSLYNDLRDNRIRNNLRLEQERIGFTWLNDALAKLG